MFLLRGGVTASVTCSEDVINFAPYTLQNTAGCVGLSDDKLQMDHEGVEVFLSFNNASAILPWISLAASNIDNSVEIDAPLEVGRRESNCLFKWNNTNTECWIRLRDQGKLEPQRCKFVYAS